MGKRGLIATSGLLWAIAAFNILRKGIPAIISDHRVLVVLIAIAIGTGFFLMFRKVSGKYIDRVWNLEGEKFPIYKIKINQI